MGPILTPALASQLLDRWGPPRRLAALARGLDPIPDTPELLRLLRSRLSSRVRWVSCHTGLSERTVRQVLRSLFATSPGKPEGFEHTVDTAWLNPLP